MLDGLQWPTLEARRDQSSLPFFRKIHCGTMSIGTMSIDIKRQVLDPVSENITLLTVLHGDALKYHFSPRTSLAPTVIAAEIATHLNNQIFFLLQS